MSKADEVVVSNHDAGEGTTRSYTIGFLLSLILTLVAYWIVQRHVNHGAYSRFFVMAAIFCLAVAQLFVQLVYFLHLGKGSKSRWNWTVLVFALGVVVIIVGGSLWIMSNLNTHMTPAQEQQYLTSQDGL